MNTSQGKTILIVEDDEAVRENLALTLELHGFRVFAAADGNQGLEAAQREGPTLIISDISMPGLNGFQLLEKLQEDELLRSIPVIMLTARVEREDIRRGMELGAADFISKPFSEQELINSITARLNQKALLDELDAFAHTVAHDLRNPLGTLGMRLELLDMQLRKGGETRFLEHVTGARRAAERLAGIVDELLILAGVRRQTVIPCPLDMNHVVEEAVDRLDQLLKQHNAKIQLPETWPAAFGHAPWVMEIWVNYISNAAKYGGTPPTIMLGGETLPDGKAARFWVQDRGPGLDQAAQQKMFVPFTSISSKHAGGHGLGLSIVQRIVEKLGGRVGVDSTPGQGARFWFELPTTAPKAAASLPFH